MQARDSHTRIQANAQDPRATTPGGDQFPGPLNHDCFCQRLGLTFARPCTRARCLCGHAPDGGTHIDLEQSIGIIWSPVTTRQRYAFVAQEAGVREVESFEANTHPFIVKIWLEETVEEARQATWRGQITHVPSGKRRVFSDLSDMTTFIVPYLESMGVRPGFWQRVKQRLVRLRR
jgi:hypothetical protein